MYMYMYSVTVLKVSAQSNMYMHVDVHVHVHTTLQSPKETISSMTILQIPLQPSNPRIYSLHKTI